MVDTERREEENAMGKGLEVRHTRWKQRPPDSNWGDFGPDDQLGRLNLLTEERIVRAAREIRTGQRFCLSLPLEYPGGNKLNPFRFPPKVLSTQRRGKFAYNMAHCCEHPGVTDVICDDYVVLYTQYSTQWDSFAHVGSMFDVNGNGDPQAVFYNGFAAGEHIDGQSRLASSEHEEQAVKARRLGIENFAATPIQGRGVLVDLHKHFGSGRTEVNYDQLMAVLAHDKIEVEPGDLLCLHTGFADMVLSMQGDPDGDRLHNSCCVLDGRDQRLLDWIRDSQIAALIADNYAVERRPPAGPGGTKGAFMPIHELCLFKQGIPLGELWHLGELASELNKQGRHHFFLTAPPLRLTGSVGSPVTPVATI
jgi:kynurenine formamidase